MGWWRINDSESGHIDFGAANVSGTANALPGQDDNERLYCGDGPADVMERAFEQIDKLYIEAWGRPVKPPELRACFNFCFRP